MFLNLSAVKEQDSVDSVWQLCGINDLTCSNILFRENVATLIELGNGIIVRPCEVNYIQPRDDTLYR